MQSVRIREDVVSASAWPACPSRNKQAPPVLHGDVVQAPPHQRCRPRHLSSHSCRKPLRLGMAVATTWSCQPHWGISCLQLRLIHHTQRPCESLQDTTTHTGQWLKSHAPITHPGGRGTRHPPRRLEVPTSGPAGRVHPVPPSLAGSRCLLRAFICGPLCLSASLPPPCPSQAGHHEPVITGQLLQASHPELVISL